MGLLRRLVDERLIIVLILINTIVIVLRAFPNWHSESEDLLFLVDYACTAYFVAEIVIKVRLYGWQAYRASGWNRFDFLVVLLSSPMLFHWWLDTHDYSFLLVLRLGRVLRAFRLLRFVPDADRLWAGIARALRASIGVLIALAVYDCILALAACYLFGEAAPEHFGDPAIAAYTMFKVFTVEGWYEIPDAIAAGSSVMLGLAARVFFVFAVATGGLFGLSMANAIFVDEMVMDNTDHLEARLDEVLAAIGELNTRLDKERTPQGDTRPPPTS